jgi:hypothetical protein
MCIFKSVERFIQNGADTFYYAAKGIYKDESNTVSELKEELFGQRKSREDDKKNLLNDRKQVEGDMRRAYDKIVLDNG